MPTIATFTDKKASDVIIYEEPLARFSREAIKVTATVKIGDLLKESATVGTFEPATTAADFAAVRYVAIHNYDDVFADRMAVLARHCMIRDEKLNWPAGTTDAEKKLLADSLESSYQLLIRKQGI